MKSDIIWVIKEAQLTDVKIMKQVTIKEVLKDSYAIILVT